MPKPGAAPGVPELADRWATRLAHTNGVSLSAGEIRDLLTGFADEVRAAQASALDAAARRFAALYQTAPFGIALADTEGIIVEANPALAEILGGSPEDYRGRAVAELAAADADAETLRGALLGLADRPVPLRQQKLLLQKKDSDTIAVRATLTALPGDRGDVDYPLLMIENVDDLDQLRETLRVRSVHDFLTGLPNAANINSALDAAVANPSAGKIALIYLDIDGFKVINDGLGSSTADDILRAVARKLTSVFCGHHSIVARLFGDGFAVLLRGPTLTTQEVVRMVERAIEELAEPIYVEEVGVGVSLSAGIVVSDVGRYRADDLSRGAEIALHRAKESGKAKWVLFDPDSDARDRRRYRLGAMIAGALEHGQFTLIYQPTVKLADRRQLVVVNAGLRWDHPEYGKLGEEEFQPLAETTGMTVALGRYLLSSALAAVARWRTRFGNAAPEVCLTMPNRLAIEDELVTLVKEELDRNALPAGVLRLCTNGSSILDPRGELLESMSVLTDLGAHMVLQVSGTADLELIRTRQLPVRHVILTGPVVEAVADREDQIAADHLRYLISRARELGLRIGAEGVRSDDHAAHLRELGVLAARGSFVTESATGDDIDDLIAGHTN